MVTGKRRLRKKKIEESGIRGGWKRKDEKSHKGRSSFAKPHSLKNLGNREDPNQRARGREGDGHLLTREDRGDEGGSLSRILVGGEAQSQ